MEWGGAEEQRKAWEGDLNAKDWHDEVCQVIERAMEVMAILKRIHQSLLWSPSQPNLMRGSLHMTITAMHCLRKWSLMLTPVDGKQSYALTWPVSLLVYQGTQTLLHGGW